MDTSIRGHLRQKIIRKSERGDLQYGTKISNGLKMVEDVKISTGSNYDGQH